ncbi:MAG: c-type cytochrome [Saprospiraceae bacterium]|nr:MAG: c-type cytochrome [Saprospiraceae bacterium]
MKCNSLYGLAALVLFFAACKKDNAPSDVQLDDQLEQALLAASGGVGDSHYVLPMSSEFNKIPQDPKNPLTQEKVNLGALLYHETGMALIPKQNIGMQTYSCASCHFASAGFQAGRHQGISEGGSGFGINGEGRHANPDYAVADLDVQPIRTPATLNIAYQEAILWNGQFGATGVNAGTQLLWTPGTPKQTNTLGYQGTETQAIAGLQVHRMKMDDQVCASLNYQSLFDAAFPDTDPAIRYDREHAGLAIAAYERTLLANQAPFQLWLRGNKNAMTQQEKRGATLFFGKAGCTSCHNGPSLANMEFYALGMKDLFENPETTYGAGATSDSNLGRFSFTQNEADKYKFKVPQLYNMADSPFYGHGASFTNLRQVVAYLNLGVKENGTVPDGQLAAAFKPLNLTEGEVDDITAFLTNGLHDPNLLRYQPLSIRSGNCFPNNDTQSRVDLGCD